jgi:hypothetical protein
LAEAGKRKGIFSRGMARAAVASAVASTPAEMQALDATYDEILAYFSLDKKLGVNASVNCGYYPIVMENRSRLLLKNKTAVSPVP